MKRLLLLIVMVCSGCASYVTPGGPVKFADIDRADVAEVAARKPSPHFPANLAVVRVQVPQYRSYSSDGFGEGQYSVLTTQELLTEANLAEIHKWPALSGAVTLNRLLLPSRLDSLDSLRVAAAKLQADVMLVYTLDTTFRIQGRGYGPLSAISLGLVPDRDAFITCTASAIFTDVRTGFIYGTAESTTRVFGLTNVWSSRATIDKKRTEAEQEAFQQLLLQASNTWSQIAKRYQ